MSKKIIWVVLSILAALLAVWIWTFASIGNMPIVIGGSTSANSFMQGVITKIKTKDYSYNSTGSQNGMNGVLNNVYKGGVLSKNPTFDEPYKWTSFVDKETENEITSANFVRYEESKLNDKKSFSAAQLAVDAIIIIYNPPGKISEGEEINFELPEMNSSPTPEQKIISKIYEGKITDWSSIDKNLHGKIHAFTRETGSGTKTEFEKLTGTSDSSLANVANSNGMMYSSISNTDGSIGFVSLPFVNQIEKDSETFVAGVDGVRMGYEKDSDANTTYNLKNNIWIANNGLSNEDSIRNADYKLFRPFVFIFENKNFELLKNIFDFILNDSRSEEIYKHEGLVKKIIDIDPKPADRELVTSW